MRNWEENLIGERFFRRSPSFVVRNQIDFKKKKKGKKMQRGKKEKTLQKARVALSSYYWRFYKEVFLLKKSQ